jgi:hypothetical protein
MTRFPNAALASSCVLLASFALAAQTSAEPIPVQIAAGSLEMSGSAGHLSLTGDHGFAFEGGVSIIAGIFGPWQSCQPCLPGGPINLRAHWIDNDLPGTAAFQGTTYSQVGGLAPGLASGSVTFSGSAVAPPLHGLTATLAAPFLFQGLFSFPPADSSPSATALLSGGGTATLILGRTSTELPWWSYRSARYEFEPVPEPATLLLVGTALSTLALRRRRVS